MTKNQFRALKPGDKIKCSCNHCNGAIWIMVKHSDYSDYISARRTTNGITAVLKNLSTLERVE